MKFNLSSLGKHARIGKPAQALILGLCIAGAGVIAQTLTRSGNSLDLNSKEGEQLLINLNSKEGEQLLSESQSRQDYWPLSLQFVTQDNLAFCGVASSVMVLNALSIPAPPTQEYGAYRIFTQRNLFSEPTRKIVKPEIVSRKGMTLEQLGKLLESYPVKAKVYHSADSSLEEFRTLAVKNLQEPKNFVLINYFRDAIGQEEGGHFSPLAAYNEKTDRFLILDVSRYKYPPVWVSAADLWGAIATTDSDSGKTRGFVLVSPR